MTWNSTRITAEHDLSQFDCGKDVLNKWLLTMALASEERWTSRTYVWVRDGDPAVRAYYSIAPTSVDPIRDGISQKLSSGMRSVPAFLLAKFALDQSLQGQGLGEQLLIDAITKIMGVAQVSGGRLIVVDAIDESAFAFYRKYDFIPVQNTPNRLIMKMATALHAFGIG